MIWLMAGFLDSELIFQFAAHLWYHYLSSCPHQEITTLVMNYQSFFPIYIIRIHGIHYQYKLKEL